MATAVFEIELKDKRIFRIFCANASQKRKVIDMYHQDLNGKVKDFRTITNGLHTVKQFREIINHL